MSSHPVFTLRSGCPTASCATWRRLILMIVHDSVCGPCVLYTMLCMCTCVCYCLHVCVTIHKYLLEITLETLLSCRARSRLLLCTLTATTCTAHRYAVHGQFLCAITCVRATQNGFVFARERVCVCTSQSTLVVALCVSGGVGSSRIGGVFGMRWCVCAVLCMCLCL